MTALLLLIGLAFIVAAAPREIVIDAVRERNARRRSRVALPALVDALAAGLAAGLSLELAFTEIAPTMPRVLARPTAAVATALRLGDPIERALTAYDGVMPSSDLAPLAIVLGAFARSGGRIGRSLGRVALAPLGASFFAILTPSYLATLTGPGRGLALVAIALETLGGLWLWRLVRATGDAPELASLLDAVVVGLDAGLSFELSLAALVARSPRVARLPEARRLLADLRLGRPPRDAFAAFAESGADEARVAALVESAARFGAPLADLLVAQADALRDAGRRQAEARARRLPLLMCFPLSFCVLPALLVVFLGPPLLSLVG